MDDGPATRPGFVERIIPPMRRLIARGLGTIDTVVEWCCHLLITVIVAITVMQVALRYLLNQPTSWSEEIALLCLVWFGMLALALGVSRHWHIAITVVRDRLPPRAAVLLDVLAQVLILVLASVLVVKGFDLVAVTGRQVLPASGLPKLWLYLPGIVGGGMAALNAVGNLLLWRLEPPRAKARQP